MNKIFVIGLFFTGFLNAQSFAPNPEEVGSTAIFKDSSVFIAWATNVVVHRGYLDIENPNLGFVSNGETSGAIGKVEGNSFDIVSLGDSGVAILTFDRPIENGGGPDFAVFENGFANDYLELAFVEVSSDGVNYVRFPSVSEASIITQIGPFEFSDCRFFNNFAGKYRQGFGTPFDLEELKDEVNLDVMNITHVKLVDVVGTIDPLFGSFDSQGNVVNDLYPTPFPSGGFDLDGVGVIHQVPLSINEKKKEVIRIYPNPAQSFLNVTINGVYEISILNVNGRLIYSSSIDNNLTIDVSNFENGVYFLKLKNKDGVINEKINIVK